MNGTGLMRERKIFIGGWSLPPELLIKCFGPDFTYIDCNLILPELFDKKYYLDKSFITLICRDDNSHYIHWGALYKLLNTINNILLTSSDKDLSSQTVLLLCKKEFADSETKLHASGFRRDLLTIDTVDTIPQIFAYLLDV